MAAGEGESREKAERERQRKEQRDAKLLNDQKAIVEVLRKCKDRADHQERSSHPHGVELRLTRRRHWLSYWIAGT